MRLSFSIVFCLAVCSAVCSAVCNGCGSVGSYQFGDDLTHDRPVEDQLAPEDLSEQGVHDPAFEELEMEDQIALADVIRARLAAESEETAPIDLTSSVPPAHLNLKLSSKQCMAELEERGIEFTKPGFDTPNVGAPLFLEGPINGVTIVPRWPQAKRTNAVMDCHLVLALVELSKQAAQQGIEKIMFYSTYRPLKQPPKKCKKGKAGKKCRRLKKQYKKASKNPSQHRRALAIDIRWLVKAGGETIDVLEHYDRKSGTPPCSYEPSDSKAQVLTNFACDLHEKHVFNVMLTPNANKAHHNHFHFDLTPEASWYIIR